MSEWKSSLLKPKPVRTDVFIRLEPDEVEMLREASEQGLTPTTFSVAGDIAVLRLDKKE